MNRLATLMAFCAISSMAHAAELEKDLTLCRDTSDTKLRLACYDRVMNGAYPAQATSVPNTQAPEAAPDPGIWINRVSKDAMSDFENSVWVVGSSTEISSQLGINNVTPTLFARCSDSKTNVFVNWDRFITSGGVDNEQQVSYRIDDKKVVRTDWLMSTDFEATFSNNAVALLKALKGGKQLRVSTIPYGDNEVQASFDITGIDVVVADIAKRCGWKP
jgi:type VI secretion system VasI family protein